MRRIISCQMDFHSYRSDRPQSKMMLLSALRVTVSLIAATLAVGSGRNMLQTLWIANNVKETSSPPDETRFHSFATLSMDEALHQLQAMRRYELLELFLSSQDPHLLSLQGEWNGILLNNNGLGMVRTP